MKGEGMVWEIGLVVGARTLSIEAQGLTNQEEEEEEEEINNAKVIICRGSTFSRKDVIMKYSKVLHSFTWSIYAHSSKIKHIAHLSFYE